MVSVPAQASHLGQVATNTYFPGASSSVSKQINTSSPHYARDNITSLQVVFANAYGLNEVNIGPATITAAVEYPAGTFTPFKFSGALTGSVAGGALITSDALAITIPKNAKFNVRSFYQNPNGIIYYALPFADAQFLSASAASGLTDKTQGGSLSPNVNVFLPTALIAMTETPSIGIIGDSIAYGTFTAPAGTGKDIGLFNAALGPSLAVMNLAAAGDTATGFLNVSKSGLRRQLLKYATGIVTDYGNNDIVGGRTPAQLQTDLQSIAQLPDIAGKKLYVSTLFPKVANSGDFKTRGSQTRVATESQRVAANALIRAGLAGYTGIVDYADVFEGGRDLGTWTVDGAGKALTQDGTHLVAAGAVFGTAAGILTAAQFASNGIIQSATLIDPIGGATLSYSNPNWSTCFTNYCAETFSSVTAASMQGTAGVVILNFETGNGFPVATASLSSTAQAFLSTNTVSPFTLTNAISNISTTSGASVTVQYRYFDNTYKILSTPDVSQGIFLVQDRTANDTMVSGTQGLVAGRVYDSPNSRAGGTYLTFDQNLSQFGVVLNANSASCTDVVCLFDRESVLIAKYALGIAAHQPVYFGIKSPSALIRSAWIGQTSATNGLIIDDISFVRGPAPTTSITYSFAGSGGANGWSYTSGTTLTTNSSCLTIQGSTSDSKIYRSITLPAGSYTITGTASGIPLVHMTTSWSNPDFVGLNLSQTPDWRTDHVTFTTTGGTCYLIVQVNSSSGTVNISSLNISSINPTPYSPNVTALQDAKATLGIVRGMLTTDHSASGYTPLFDVAYFTELKNWGCNVARVQLWPASYANSKRQDFWTAWSTYVPLLIQTIQNAQMAGVKVVLDLHEMPFTDVPPIGQTNWTRSDLGERFATVWRNIAQAVVANNLTSAVWAYELTNEPFDGTQMPNPPRQLWPLAANVIKTIRAVDANTWFVFDVGPGYLFKGFTNLVPLPDTHVIYSAHFYYPDAFTGQGVFDGYPTNIHYDSATTNLASFLAPADAFTAKWPVPIYVGEFSCPRWGPVPDTANWLSDLITLLEARQWSWSYCAWASWNGWRLDMDNSYTPNNPPASLDDNHRTDRGQVIYNALQNN